MHARVPSEGERSFFFFVPGEDVGRRRKKRRENGNEGRGAERGGGAEGVVGA